MEQYTDLRIIDCNRVDSIESQNDNDLNKALYTNDIGDGLKLNVGDSISVHGAFVSEVGAGSDTIEFKGNNIVSSSGAPKFITLKHTLETPLFPTRDWDKAYQNIMGGYQAHNSSEVETEPIILKDNECTITTQYWTSNNGHGYVFLPRRFAYDKDYDGNNSSNVVNELWDDIENTDTGLNFNYPRFNAYVPDDYQFYRNGIVYAGGALSKYPRGQFVPRNNNKRFTIMRRMGDTFYRNTISTYDGNPGVTPTLPVNRNPASFDYKIYKKLVNIKVTKGMNSPSDVSEQITQQLKESKEPLQFNALDTSGQDQHITTTQETNTWKPFTCGSFEHFDKTGFDSFQTATDPAPLRAYQHNAIWENIAVKRADLFEAGRACNTIVGMELPFGVTHASRIQATLKTTYLYNTDTLTKLSTLFKTQGFYPELFEDEPFEVYLTPPSGGGNHATIDNCRFLHINTHNNIKQGNQLGNDSIIENPVSSDINGSDYSSVPVFFKYQPELADVDTGGLDINNLSYGFAMKYFVGTTAYIEFRPDLLGGMTSVPFQQWISNASGLVEFNIAADSKIGWDWHFSAYSTSAMVLWGGRMDRDYYNNNIWGVQNASQTPLSSGGLSTNVSRLLTQRYVGANDPLFNFDSVISRFNFSRLHTAETAGQTNILAGMSFTDAPLNNPNFASEVYKMNPRFNRWELTPNLKPYISAMSASWASGAFDGVEPTDVQSIPIMSRQVDPFTVFDSSSGIYISNFGYNKEDFSKGLWSILGFTFDQFNSNENASLNRLSRVDDTNKDSLSIITTNCNVIASQTGNYNVNTYGSIFNSNQIAAPQVMVGPSAIYIDGVESTAVAPRTIPVFPPITEGTESIKINAINLPRKMLRPYYLIRSDIIEQPKYIGSDKALGCVVGICDKQYSGGDFYFGADNQFNFRVTKARTITSIRTSIHDPDGSFANVNGDSAVIYKITKNIKNDVDILSDYLKQK